MPHRGRFNRQLKGFQKILRDASLNSCRGVPPWAPLLKTTLSLKNITDVHRGAPTEGDPTKIMSTEIVNVTVNGKAIQVPKGARLIDVCRENGYDIPSFCYYSDLALQASCRMCLVRIEKMPKLQTSCTITCTDGMVVTTQSDEIEKAQRAMLEFLLANHPLDCPVCDRGGECELQEMTFDWGGLEERFTEKKNYYPER